MGGCLGLGLAGWDVAFGFHKDSRSGFRIVLLNALEVVTVAILTQV